MAQATKPRKVIPDEDIKELLKLLKGSDTVELKLTVPDDDHRSATTALEMDPLDAQIRQVYFYDTPDLALNASGLVVRARRIQPKGGDSVVKLRPVVPDDLPGKLRALPGFGVEVDAMPGGFVCSGRLKEKVGVDDPKRAAAGKLPIRKLFSKAQRSFFAEHGPEGVGLDDLAILGPITVFKLKFVHKDFDRSLVAEMWTYPDYTRILELSLKCQPGEAFNVAAEARAFLSENGVDLEGEQQTKTKTALEFFAKQLKSGATKSK